MTAIGYFIGFIDRDKEHYRQFCTVQSFVTTFSSMVSFFWTCCLALYLHAIAVSANAQLGRRIVIVFHFLSWPVPLLISVAAISAGVLGQSEDIDTAGWCWIAVKCDANTTEGGSCSRTKPVLWMLFAGKFWEIISYVLIMISYMRIWWHVRKQRQQSENMSTDARLRMIERRLISLPVLFIVIRIWGTINFFRYAAGMNGNGPLIYLQAFGDGSQGFVNGVLFCLMTERATTFFRQCCQRRGGDHLLSETPSINYGAAIYK